MHFPFWNRAVAYHAAPCSHLLPLFPVDCPGFSAVSMCLLPWAAVSCLPAWNHWSILRWTVSAWWTYPHSKLVCCCLEWPSPSPSSLLRILHANENEFSLSACRIYSEQKSLRFDAVTCLSCLRKDSYESKKVLTIRKKFRTTISFLRRPKYAFVDPFWVSPKIGLIWWSVWGHFLKRFCGNNGLMAYRTMDRPTFGGSLRLGASPLSLYSEQKSLRFSARGAFIAFSRFMRWQWRHGAS